ncbi:hypothetical protein B0H14DRAFT_3440995 [Mycena olivaceomarginata]|nr:hypothetical protein B0H14DRAFT_3440995 [Mycena olivaceomarginata]
MFGFGFKARKFWLLAVNSGFGAGKSQARPKANPGHYFGLALALFAADKYKLNTPAHVSQLKRIVGVDGGFFVQPKGPSGCVQLASKPLAPPASVLAIPLFCVSQTGDTISSTGDGRMFARLEGC